MADINAAVREALNEQLGTLTKRFEGMMSQKMEEMMASFTAKLQLSSPTPPPIASTLIPQANNSGKAPEATHYQTMPLEDVIVTGIGSSAPPLIPIPHASPVATGPNDETAKLLARMEQRIREVEGTHNIPQIDFDAFSKVNVPEKFKMPDFEKYNGTSNPVQHVQMYQVRMNKYATNRPSMVQTFQASLKDAAMTWYTDYKIYGMEDGEKVANEFVRHFGFNIDVVITREDLERSKIKKGETIKQYATRWRNVASRLKPVPPELELMRLFVSTLPQAVRSRVLGTAATSFSHLISMAEEVENGLKKGWYGDISTSNKRFTVKKDKESAPQVNMTYARKPIAQTPAV
ncbi:uncharacterized protein LOC125315517 [Rhodamnia argentea]|uniref:Uncharacterized protein LOC125315517 n=1 Tax=Rhodamnia argentea TaxID=178133 RepID=A0ABM3HJ66_9MYRT|nr:uncharacterized protein LOC125315517 [Rhodamnia argentea]